MTTLKLTIQNIVQNRNFSFPMVSIPTISMVEKSYQETKKQLGEGVSIEPMEQKQSDYWANEARKIAQNGTWSNASASDLKNIGKCLWYGESPLAGDNGFLKDFLNSCDNKIKKSLCRVLIWIYLFNYGSNKIGISILGKWLEKAVVTWDWHWSDKQKTFNLFGNDTAHSYIADAVLLDTHDINDTLTFCGIGGNLQSAGMASAAFGDAYRKFKTIAKNSDSKYVFSYLNRLLTWACVDGETFNYPSLKIPFIECLLLPWISITPNPDIKTKIQSFLIDCFGDPRLGKTSWNGVNEEAMRVIRGWLVESSLKQFLDVVDELAVEHQWQYRRKFWLAYFNKNHISDAWVAFANNGEYKALEIAKRTNDNSWLSFGEFDGSGDQNHAVLILRIGDVIIADYSHNGKCRIWNRGNKKAPTPYASRYGHADLMYGNADSEYRHVGSPNHVWQGRVADKIAETTGIRLNEKDYML